MVHYGLQDEIDWASITFDTILQLATLGFAGKLSDAAVEAILGETKQFTRPILKLAVEAVVSGGLNDVRVVALTLFTKLRDKKQKWTVEEFIILLAKEFATGVLMHSVMTAAQRQKGLAPSEEAGTTSKPARAFGGKAEPTAPSKKVAPVENETPAGKKAASHEPTAKAVEKDKALVVEPTEDGKHEVVVTPEGVGRCSGPPCPVISVEYKRELDSNPELKSWNDHVQALRTTDPQRAADEGKRLIAACEEVRAGGGQKIGPAYATSEEVDSLVEGGHLRQDAHKLGVIVKDPSGKVRATWYEVSEEGVGTEHDPLLGHTEQKALSRIERMDMPPGSTVEFVGGLQACNFRQGCANRMTSFAERTGIDIRYRHVYGESGSTVNDFSDREGRLTKGMRKKVTHSH
jgi:hypothetical protein